MCPPYVYAGYVSHWRLCEYVNICEQSSRYQGFVRPVRLSLALLALCRSVVLTNFPQPLFLNVSNEVFLIFIAGTFFLLDLTVLTILIFIACNFFSSHFVFQLWDEKLSTYIFKYL